MFNQGLHQRNALYYKGSSSGYTFVFTGFTRQFHTDAHFILTSICEPVKISYDELPF